MDSGWADQVRRAQVGGDGEELRLLFDLALAAEGREGASRSWLAAISAFDADAVTG